MADENLQEPTAEERAKFEQDLENIMKQAAEAEKAEANGTQDSPAADASADAQGETEAAPESTESAEDILKAELAAANDRNLRLMAEFDNFRRRSAKEQLEIIETANGKLLGIVTSQ